MTTPTTNAVPSNSPLDLLFNAEKLDEAINASALTYADRLGVTRKTLAGAVATISAINVRGAWVTATAYAPKDVVSNSGTWYIALDTHTSGATFAGDLAAHWRVYQGVLASDLASTASGKGASTIGVQDAANGFPDVGTKTVESVLADLAGRFYGANVLKYGADKTGASDSTAAFVSAAATGHPVYAPAGTYATNWVPTSKFLLCGDGSNATFIKPFNTATGAITYKAGAPFWTYHSEIRSLCLLGSAKVGVGFTCAQFNPATYAVGDEYFNNVRFFGVLFSGLRKGAQFPSGNIGETFIDCGFTGNFYGLYCLNNKSFPSVGSSTLMHAGNKYCKGGQFDNNDCAVYVHNTADGFGGLDFDGTIFEHNKINAYVYTTNTFTPVRFRGIWSEQNGVLQGGSTTLDQWTGTTLSTAAFTNRAWIFDGDQSTYLFDGGGVIADINLIATSSRVVVRGARTERGSGTGGGACTVADAASQIVFVDPETDGGVPISERTFVEGMLQARRTAAADAGTRFANTRHRFNKVASYGGVGAIQKFITAQASTSFVVTPTTPADGILYTACNQYAVPSATAGQFGDIPSTSITPTAGQWVAITLDVKWVSGVAPALYFGDLSANQIAAGMTAPEIGVWYTIGAVGKALNTAAMRLSLAGNASACTFKISAFQARVFDTRHEAQAFLAASVYVES